MSKMKYIPLKPGQSGREHGHLARFPDIIPYGLRWRLWWLLERRAQAHQRNNPTDS